MRAAPSSSGDDTFQAAPAPRFSRSTCEIQGPPPRAGQHTDEVLSEYGFSREAVSKLRDANAIA